jgi:cobalt/nickel transport system permease protein
MAGRRRLPLFAFIAIGLATAAALVIFVAPRASSSPDGLEKVAADKGIDAGARDHSLGASPFADYGTSGIDDATIGTVVAGLVGIAATFVVCAALVYAVRRRRSPPASPATPITSPPA